MYNLTATACVFLLILVLNRTKIHLALAILIGSITMGIAFRLSISEIITTILTGAVQTNTIALFLLVLLLITLSQLMQTNDTMTELIKHTRSILKRPRAVMAALPAMIGLLPMPGGAIFSAPMVKEAAGAEEYKDEEMSAINYWYRHIWEHCWPLYPGIILAATLTNNSMGQFIIYQIPLGFFMVISGLLIFMRIPKKEVHAKSFDDAGSLTGLTGALTPIWIILSTWIAISFAIENMNIRIHPASAKYIPITIGVMIAILWSAHKGRTTTKSFLNIFKNKKIYEIGALVLAVMTFKHMLTHVEAAPGIAAELSAHNVPIILIVILLPFIAGMVTGLAIGFVGTSFPILLGLLEATPDLGPIRPYIVLAYAFGHLGQMMSPLHLCHIVSNKYFNASFKAVYPYILPPAILCAILSFGYFLILKHFLT